MYASSGFAALRIHAKLLMIRRIAMANYQCIGRHFHCSGNGIPGM
jgi:hypothetical protein